MADNSSRITIVASVLMFGGCIPATYVSLPAIRGRVLDANSEPVSGAEVKITRDSKTVDSLTTNGDGMFSRPERSQFLFYLVPMDINLTPYEIQARSGSSKSPTTQVTSCVRYFLIFGPPKSGEDLGTLRLHDCSKASTSR